MWHRKQIEAYASLETGKLVVARYVSASGHKSYGVMTRPQIDALGPGHVYEVISPTSVCFLYFDLEHPRVQGDPDDDELCEELIAGVRSLLLELYHVTFDNEDICVCDSSNAHKFSRHLMFSDGVISRRLALALLPRFSSMCPICMSFLHQRPLASAHMTVCTPLVLPAKYRLW